MKSRELMNCEIKVFSTRIAALKPKEVQRHIAWAATHLGVADKDALTRAVLDAMFNDGELPQTSAEEMRRVLNAVSPWVADAEGQAEPLLRLVALYLTFIRDGVQDVIRSQRRRDRRSAPAAGSPDEHTHCHDPDCRDHDHTHEPRPRTAPNPLARGIRAVIA